MLSRKKRDSAGDLDQVALAFWAYLPEHVGQTLRFIDPTVQFIVGIRGAAGGTGPTTLSSDTLSCGLALRALTVLCGLPGPRYADLCLPGRDYVGSIKS